MVFQNRTQYSPNIELVAFERVEINKGDSTTIDFTVSFKQMAVANVEEQYLEIQPGTYELHVGGGQPPYYEGSLSAVFNVQGSTTPVRQC